MSRGPGPTSSGDPGSRGVGQQDWCRGGDGSRGGREGAVCGREAWDLSGARTLLLSWWFKQGILTPGNR